MRTNEYFGIGTYHGLGYAKGHWQSWLVEANQREEREKRNAKMREDMPKYCDPSIPYDQRDKRFYAAKYCLIFRRLAKIAKEIGLSWHESASMSNRAMGYNITYKNTFKD